MNQTDLITLAKAGFTKDDILALQQAMQYPQGTGQPMQYPQGTGQPMQYPQGTGQPMQYPQGTGQPMQCPQGAGQPMQQPYVPVLPQTAPQYTAPQAVVADPLGEALKNMRQSQAAGMGNDYNLSSVVGSIIGANK